jgi:serine protease
MPIDGACAAGTTPLYRLYNNRWLYNDSNHRFVSRQDLREKMASQGWIDEGVAMCLIPNYP